MNGCLFCKIVHKEIPAKIVRETDHFVAFHDIHPVAPVHVLVIPKTHVVGIADATAEHATALSELLLGARSIASELGLDAGGYRLVINNGPNAGQSVFHLHLHVIGGRPMAWPPG